MPSPTDDALLILADGLFAGDTGRVERTLRRLNGCGLAGWALTGGLAIGAIVAGVPRALNDLDVVVPGLEALPAALGDQFLVRHFHPAASQGRLLAQLVDPEQALRVDIFGAPDSVFRRTRTARLSELALRLLSPEDLVARLARILIDLERGEAVPAKHALDYRRLLPLADRSGLHAAWRDHRRPADPADFAEARQRIEVALDTRSAGLVEPVYAVDPDAPCLRCYPNGVFRLADARHVMAILGYC